MCSVDHPTERRVRKWGFGLPTLLMDPIGVKEFQLFLDGEFSSENLNFWRDVEELKRIPAAQIEAKVNEIFR